LEPRCPIYSKEYENYTAARNGKDELDDAMLPTLVIEIVHWITEGEQWPW